MALIILPNAGQSLAVTRNPIRSNFSTINNAFKVDHVEMTAPGTAAPQGFHNKVTFNLRESTPTFSGNNGYWSQLFPIQTDPMMPLLGTGTGQPEIWVQTTQMGINEQYPLTASSLGLDPSPVALTKGWAYLPCGIILQWLTGVIVSGPGTSQLFTFPIPFTQPLNVQVTPRGIGTFYVSGTTPTGTTVFQDSGATNVNFFIYAIGY